MPKETVITVPGPSPDLGLDGPMVGDLDDPRFFLLDESGFLLDREAMEQVMIERAEVKRLGEELAVYKLGDAGVSVLAVFGVVVGGLALLGGGVAIGYGISQASK